MRTHVSKRGHSLAIRLPGIIAEQAVFDEGRRIELELVDEGARIILAKPNYTLEELLTGARVSNIPDGLDFASLDAERL
jgi:antitoxin component of MazEF toxin-antitoxin module